MLESNQLSNSCFYKNMTYSSAAGFLRPLYFFVRQSSIIVSLVMLNSKYQVLLCLWLSQAVLPLPKFFAFHTALQYSYKLLTNPSIQHHPLPLHFESHLLSLTVLLLIIEIPLIPRVLRKSYIAE
jgi:hypothetical protein